MQVNVEQHELFIPKVEELEQYLKDVQEGKAKYDGKHIVDTVESFGDVMVDHLTAVGSPMLSSYNSSLLHYRSWPRWMPTAYAPILLKKS